VKKSVILFLSFFLLISLFSTQIVNARLPTFTGNYVISDYYPTVDRRVTITVYVNIYDPDGQQIPFITLNVYLIWSRDASVWHSVTMTTTTFEVFTGDIPAQDGSDNKLYNYGEGRLYWYALMRNEANEEDTLFSASDPNTEVYYSDPWASETTSPTGDTSPTQNAGIFEPIFSVFNAFIDPTTNPFVRLTLVAIVGLIVFILASRGRGLGFVTKSLSGLFKK